VLELKRDLKGRRRLHIDDWRVIFSMDDRRKRIVVLRIRRRDEGAYDRLPRRAPKT
jgi:mRNA-degrading endonuclease RelE of RelBE toxin-antitoxin system